MTDSIVHRVNFKEALTMSDLKLRWHPEHHEAFINLRADIAINYVAEHFIIPEDKAISIYNDWRVKAVNKLI